MSNNSYIRKAIEKFVIDNSFLRIVIYSNWYIGITNDDGRRKKQHEAKNNRKIKIFKPWTADSPEHAARIEKEFHAKGMKGAGGGWAKNSNIVYVYKRAGPKS